MPETVISSHSDHPFKVLRPTQFVIPLLPPSTPKLPKKKRDKKAAVKKKEAKRPKVGRPANDGAFSISNEENVKERRSIFRSLLRYQKEIYVLHARLINKKICKIPRNEKDAYGFKMVLYLVFKERLGKNFEKIMEYLSKLYNTLSWD